MHTRSIAMPKKKISLCGVFSVTLLSAARLYGQTSGAALLSVDPSPRSYALGSVDAIASSGAQAVGQNPANLGLMREKYEVFTSYQTLLNGAQYGHVALALKRPGFLPAMIDGLGLAVTHLGSTGLTGTDANANLTGAAFSANDTALTLGASASIAPNLDFGLDVKGVQSQIGSYSSNWALAADLGLTWTLSHDDRPLTLAVSADNIGQGLKFISQTDPLPSALKVAAAVPFGGSAMAMAQVENLIYDHATQAGLGFEYGIGPASLRAGYSYAFNAPTNLALGDQSGPMKILGGLSGGVGLRVGAFRFDYAMSQQAVDYGTTQRLSMTIAWGGGGSGEREHRPVAKKRGSIEKNDAVGSIRSDWMLDSLGGF